MTTGNWRRMTLGEFVRLQRGHDLPADARRPGTVPVFGSAGPNGFHDTALAKGPGVVVGRSGVGSAGVVSFAPTDFWPHNTVLYVTDFLGNNERFAYYLLQTLDLRRFDSGSAQASINRNFLYPIPIDVPARVEQDRIATLLGALDDKIALNSETNGTLEALARAVFEDWFMHFGPVRAKAEGRAPPGLAPDIAALFPDRLTETANGEVPEGWLVATLGELIHINSRSLGAASAPDWIQYVDISSVERSRLLKAETMLFSAAPSRARRLVRHGDTIWSCIRPNHAAYLLMDNPAPDLVVSTGFAVLTPRRTTDRAFCFLAATSEATIAWLTARADGAAYPAVRPGEFGNVPATLVPAPLRDAFEGVIGPMLDRIGANARENATLTKLRDLLLPRLISGQLHLRDAEKTLEAAL